MRHQLLVSKRGVLHCWIIISFSVADICAQIIINYRLEEAIEHVVIIGEEDSTQISIEMQEKIEEIFSDLPDLSGSDLSSKESIENVLMSNDLGEEDEFFWTVDPIDGTKGFIRGDQYAVCIAMIENPAIELPLLPSDSSTIP